MPTEDLLATCRAVHDEASLLDFIELLATDAFVGAGQPPDGEGRCGGWTSRTISEFLDAAHAWAEDTDFGAYPGPRPDNPWQRFALLLWAGRSVE